MRSHPTEIYRAANPLQAQMLKGFLEDRGIDARVENDLLQAAGGDLPLGWTAAPRVMVAAEDESQAREAALEFDATLREHRETSPGEVLDHDDEQWKDWPRCPQCNTLRRAQCGICGTAGVSFPLADIDDSVQPPRVLLHCATCDDHFRPSFFRTCHECSHDFGSGLRIESEAPPTIDWEGSTRLWIVLGCVFLGIAVIIAYFAFLLMS